MKTDDKTIQFDATLFEAKREGQERSRALVRAGLLTQASMFLIDRATVKKLVIRHRSLDW